MEQIRTFFEWVTGLFKQYELELLYFVILLSFRRYFIQLYRFRNQRLPIQTETFILKARWKGFRLRYVFLSVFFLGSFIFILYNLLLQANYQEMLKGIAFFLQSLILIYLVQFFLIVKIKKTTIVLGILSFKAVEIKKIIFWDDTIDVINQDNVNKKIRFKYDNESFLVGVQMIQELRDFCSKHDIAFEDNFNPDPNTNELLNAEHLSFIEQCKKRIDYWINDYKSFESKIEED
ncbi:hypothetical protein [Sediminitomix flava]|uniref:Uncharacterized protein n=1 Tax=Sediminitomix flava TaxID=379075 RepID=A0A315Z8W2_SEDFL|nr:hypothetical protein [Sediminitomix flava]PWJ42016.1 hypothetical protein BC781_103266 [Sediminitomix flava]